MIKQIQALHLMVVLNPRVRYVAIDGGLFQGEVVQRHIMATLAIFLNGQPFGSGRMELPEILAKADTGATDREAQALATKQTFDVLVVGGGPAGAAAVYVAGQGIRTGLLAERLGDQTMDTMGIESYPSGRQMQGPKFATALEAQVRSG